MEMYFKCPVCGSFILIKNNYGTKEHPMCKKCFYNNQDTLAYNESCGEFSNYEDWMRDKGATICGDYDILRRKC